MPVSLPLLLNDRYKKLKKDCVPALQLFKELGVSAGVIGGSSVIRCSAVKTGMQSATLNIHTKCVYTIFVCHSPTNIWDHFRPSACIQYMQAITFALKCMAN